MPAMAGKLLVAALAVLLLLAVFHVDATEASRRSRRRRRNSPQTTDKLAPDRMTFDGLDGGWRCKKKRLEPYLEEQLGVEVTGIFCLRKRGVFLTCWITDPSNTITNLTVKCKKRKWKLLEIF